MAALLVPQRHRRVQAGACALTDRMLELNKKQHFENLAPSEIERLEREIAATDGEIDELVYRLYGITAEERKVIAGQG